MKRELSGLLLLALLCAGLPGSAAAGGDPEANGEAGAAFLSENAGKPGVVKTDSGLQYLIVVAGAGARPTPTSTVTVRYRGTLIDGTEFDSSYKRNAPAEFPLNGVIPCWTEGLQKMKVGGKAKLACPAAIAYGDRGAPPKIKPGSALLFEVELLGIEEPSVKPAGTPAGHP